MYNNVHSVVYRLTVWIRLRVWNWRSLISCTVINHRHCWNPRVFDRWGNKRKSKAEGVFMMECGVHVGLYFKPCCGVLFIKTKTALVLWLKTPSATSSPSFPAHLRFPSVTLLFSLMAFVMSLLNSVARSINTIENLESLRGRGSDATTTLCDTVFVYWFCFGKDHRLIWAVAACVFSSWGCALGPAAYMQISNHVLE